MLNTALSIVCLNYVSIALNGSKIVGKHRKVL